MDASAAVNHNGISSFTLDSSLKSEADGGLIRNIFYLHCQVEVPTLERGCKQGAVTLQLNHVAYQLHSSRDHPATLA
ncbi:MAG: hypothetical protein R3C05_18345 [Pirellulaceae bacterium]